MIIWRFKYTPWSSPSGKMHPHAGACMCVDVSKLGIALWMVCGSYIVLTWFSFYNFYFFQTWHMSNLLATSEDGENDDNSSQPFPVHTQTSIWTSFDRSRQLHGKCKEKGVSGGLCSGSCSVCVAFPDCVYFEFLVFLCFFLSSFFFLFFCMSAWYTSTLRSACWRLMESLKHI